MQSPIAALQRATYPREPHPLGPVFALRGFGLFGGTGLNQGVTGLKTGVTSAGIATSIGGGAASALGFAAAGSVVPVIGTAIGLIVGIIASGVFNRKKDKEDANFQQAMAIERQNPSGVYDIGNKYLVLAGLFDLHPDQIKGNIPIYKKYGRKGEQRFVTDMMTLIYQAGQTGQITANDTPQSVFSRIVQPWIDGFGYGPMVDSNTDMINRILLGMTAEYVMGGQNQWYAVGGQYPFTSLPKFALPVAAPYTPTTSGTPTAANQPSQVVAPMPVIPGNATPQVSAVAVPAGFVLVGQANNLPAYQGPDGAFYSWSGTTMSPLTGTLATTSGQYAQIVNGYPQQQVAAPTNTGFSMLAPSQTQAGSGPAGGTYSAPITAPMPPVTAGVTGAGLPTWLPWGAAAGVLLLMFATAHPVKGGSGKMPRRSR
jgi:hypothetical protein